MEISLAHSVINEKVECFLRKIIFTQLINYIISTYWMIANKIMEYNKNTMWKSCLFGYRVFKKQKLVKRVGNLW